VRVIERDRDERRVRERQKKISFHVPSSWGGKSGKLLLCAVFAANKEAPCRDLSRVSNFNWRVRNKIRTHEMDFFIGSTADRCFGSCEDQIFVEATELAGEEKWRRNRGVRRLRD
jgi:hypothetical protein